MNRIIGSYLSPFVRKVLVVLELKGISYEIDPIVPFFGNDQFTKLSPLRRIPVLVDDQVTLSDSSIICQYLEDRYPSPSLYPTNIADRAKSSSISLLIYHLLQSSDHRLVVVICRRLLPFILYRARWFEEYADTKMAEVFIMQQWKAFSSIPHR